MTIEEHPLKPFLPENAKILFLGSFPPPKARWSMDFFYPNWINDFWRVQGLIFHNDKHFFEDPLQLPLKGGEIIATPIKKFDLEKIVAHCKEHGLAFYDTARKVCRLKDNADDNFLEIVEGTDVFALLDQMPECRTIVTTGGKASEELQSYFAGKGVRAVGENTEIKVPKVGDCTKVQYTSSTLRGGWEGSWWRMPSTSRAYPMKLEKKAEYYRRLFIDKYA